jgi:hypothetical protein
MKRQTARPALEELGERALPSAVPVAIVPEPLVPLAQALTGRAQGTFSTDLVVSGAGNDYHLKGQGRFLGLDATNISGNVHSVGFIVHGHAGGEITLSNARGSLTLDLTGLDQSAFSPMPTQFDFSVAGGTGAYARMHGQGTLSLLLAADPAPGSAEGSFALVVGYHRPAAALDGALSGKAAPAPVPFDTGGYWTLAGQGALAGEGDVSVSGWLRSTGFVEHGHATGRLVLDGPHGSAVLDVWGPRQPGFAPLPGQFQFIVRSSTGDLADLHARGIIFYHPDDLGGSFTLSLLA